MEASEIRLIQVARQLGVVGLQAAKAYNEEQASLALHLVLTPERLATHEGTSESLATLARLSELTAAHKQAYERFVVAATTHLAQAVGDLPADRAAEYRDGIASSINRNLADQGALYAGREQWIAAVEGLCRLVDAHRGAIRFTETGTVIRDDEVLEAFERLTDTIDRIHETEVRQSNERLARLANSMAILEPPTW